MTRERAIIAQFFYGFMYPEIATSTVFVISDNAFQKILPANTVFAGTQVVLTDPAGAMPTLSAPAVVAGGDVLIFELTVRDLGGLPVRIV